MACIEDDVQRQVVLLSVKASSLLPVPCRVNWFGNGSSESSEAIPLEFGQPCIQAQG